MAVEIYTEENQDLLTEVDDLERWKEIVDELGLSGQDKLTKDGKSPIPFPYMTDAMENTYEVLCPTKTNLTEYEDGTIPLRVLDVIALCHREGYFEEIKIWHNKKDADPIAVGTAPGGESWNKKRFVIARWGDELCSFTELQQRAVKVLKETKLPEIKRRVEEGQNIIKTFDDLALQHVNGDRQHFFF